MDMNKMKAEVAAATEEPNWASYEAKLGAEIVADIKAVRTAFSCCLTRLAFHPPTLPSRIGRRPWCPVRVPNAWARYDHVRLRYPARRCPLRACVPLPMLVLRVHKAPPSAAVAPLPP